MQHVSRNCKRGRQEGGGKKGEEIRREKVRGEVIRVKEVRGEEIRREGGGGRVEEEEDEEEKTRREMRKGTIEDENQNGKRKIH